MKTTTRNNRSYPATTWFREQTATFADRWAQASWQENGDKILMPLKQSIRKYASCINELPEGFLPSVFDQHLAVLSEGYEYQILDIIEDLGDERFLCKNEQHEYFCVWSHSVAINVNEGKTAFLTAIIRLEDTSETVSAITYGPVIAWISLCADDFYRLARNIARDLLKLKGLSAVIRRDPVPFWALWTLSGIPRAMHGTEEVCTCWVEGRFTENPETHLSTGWKRDMIGKRVRLRKSGSKPFFEQVVIYDTKTMNAIVLARRNSYLEKLVDSLKTVFVAQADKEGFVTPVVEIALSDVFRIQPEYKKWTTPFDREDQRKEEVKDALNPERKAELDVFNAAMKDLLPYVNSGTIPDWKKLAATHSLSNESLESLKDMYEQLRKKLQ